MESYVESVRAQITERNNKTGQAAAMVKNLLDTYGFLADLDGVDPSAGRVFDMPPVSWPEPDGSGGGAWLNAYNSDGNRLYEHDILDQDSPAQSVGHATLMVTIHEDAEEFFTVSLFPPQVYGYDGAPVPLQQLDGVMHDLTLYEQRIQAEAASGASS